MAVRAVLERDYGGGLGAVDLPMLLGIEDL